MPKLFINNFTNLIFEVKRYQKFDNDTDWDWCDIRFVIDNDYMHIEDSGGSFIDYELEKFASWLKDIIDGKKVNEYISFTEPDFEFEIDTPMYVKMHYLLRGKNGEYTGEVLTIPLYDDTLKEFYNQLVEEMNNCLFKNNINYSYSRIFFAANHFRKNLDSKKMQQLINNSNEDIKFLCAKVKFYPKSKKEYTYLVDEMIIDTDWYTKEDGKKVYVEDFFELSFENLPVDYSKMKRIVPKEGVYEPVFSSDLAFAIVYSNDYLFADLHLDLEKYLKDFYSFENDYKTQVYWILSVLLMELIYDYNRGDVYYRNDNAILIDGIKLFDVDITLYIDENNLIDFVIEGYSFETLRNICFQLSDIFEKYRFDTAILDKMISLKQTLNIFKFRH